MRIISRNALKNFWERYPDAKQPLENWYQTTKKADWESFADVRSVFRHADVYHRCTIFDIGGNKYRLIVHIDYQYKLVFIRFVLTHSEYDQDEWKSDC